MVSEDLKLKSYKKTCVPVLTAAHIEKRKLFSHWIRNRFTKPTCRKILFSDEKIFNQDGQYNRQNDRIYVESRQAANEGIALHLAHKFSFKVMVWCGLTYNGPTKLVVKPDNMSFNSDFYIKNVLPIIKQEGI
ncbi:uncharacterized protein LOC136078497 [Hydra vulgaris]|uniref:Uncharacterized protein LOC136078497 n=1 Tax=Hydra vulgaris TaxID=6087 RepID=A0ABM4BMN4_HYDVU